MIPKSTITVSGTPATQALVDLATLKSDLGISADDTSQDARLGRIITLTSGAFAKYCGRQFIKQTYVETWRLPTSPSLYWQASTPLDNVPALPASQWPVVSVASIVAAGVTLDSSLFLIDKPIDPAQPGRGFVRLDASGAESCWARGLIVATYDAGFDPTGTESPTSPLPQELYEAALLDARVRFNGKDDDASRVVTREELTNVYSASYDLSGGLGTLGGPAGTFGICAAALVVLEAFRFQSWAA
jgi:hypothetical protein